MLLENNNYSHLQRSIDTLRSLGDRLGERNVDLRLNLHQDRSPLSFDRNNHHHHILDRNGTPLNNNGILDRNSSINPGYLDKTTNFFEKTMLEKNNFDRNLPLLDRNNSLDRNSALLMDSNRSLELMQERNLNLERLMERNDHRNLNLEHSLSLERLNLERSLAQHDRALTDRNLNNVGLQDRGDRLRGLDLQNDINEMKYRDYKVHLDNLRSTDSSRSAEGREGEDRGPSTTPPTPLAGENFQEEKVCSPCLLFSRGRPWK